MYACRSARSLLLSVALVAFGCEGADVPRNPPQARPPRAQSQAAREAERRAEAQDEVAQGPEERRLRASVPAGSRENLHLGRLCDGGEADACAELGFAYRQGKGAQRDEGHGRALYLASCERGSARGCAYAAAVLTREKDYKSAHAAAQKGCKAGLPVACHNLAYLLQHGLGAPEDDTLALELYEGACARDVVESCTNAGELVLHPSFGKAPQREREAKVHPLFERACEGGDALGCEHLARLVSVGKATKRDPARARTLYAGACERGLLTSCRELGRLAYSGEGATRDWGSALLIWDKACRDGEAKSCEHAGTLVQRGGNGVKRDIPRARELFERACKAGQASACTLRKWLP
jgi:TPR repeat protein